MSRGLGDVYKRQVTRPVQLAIDCPSQNPSSLSTKSFLSITILVGLLQEDIKISNKIINLFILIISKRTTNYIALLSRYIIVKQEVSKTSDGTVGINGSEILK